MLIYLLPADPHPRLYHSLDFTDPRERVPIPVGWVAQLQCLQLDDLDLPSTMHALDKASWLTALIEELVFDLVALTVSCTFSNGGPTMQWSMATQTSCLRVLEDVLADLTQSQIELDRERLAAAPKPEPLIDALPPPVLVKPAKHKKQRSLLSSLFSGLNKLSLNTNQDGLPSSLSSTRLAFSAPPSSPPRPSTISWKTTAVFLPMSNKIPLARPPSRPYSATLQARARSTLVDVFRRFVICELKARLESATGYTQWIAGRMLRRTEEHMAWIVQESGGVEPSLLCTMPPRSRSLTASDMSGSTLVSIAEAPLYDDDEDDQRSLTDSTSTETDGSSVHTPVDSPTASLFGHVPGTHSDMHRPKQSIPRSPSPAEFSPEDLATYTALSAQCLRLRQVIAHMDVTRMNAVSDEQSFLAVLEVKSRRRAWSNKAYMGGATMADVGLATPFRSSRLARCEPVTPEYLESLLLEVTTGDHNISTLFPVSEEDEEEEDVPAVRFVQDVALCDMESGLLPPLRPQMRPRTHSMHPIHGVDVELPVDVDASRFMVSSPSSPPSMHISPRVPASQTLPSTALLFQPLKKPMLESQTKFELFDEVDHVGDQDVAPEFTLSMDLPPPYARINGHDHEAWLTGPQVVR